MKTFIWINTVVLCSISWISVSVAQSQTVKVQSGHSVTLTSPKLSNKTTVTWSRLDKTNKGSCICYMSKPNTTAQFCDGFNIEKFEMKDNTTTVFLTIKKVDLSDSGIYFCEFFNKGNTTYNVIHLNVDGSEETQNNTTYQTKCKETDDTTYVMSLTLGGLTVFLLVVVAVLVVLLRKLQTVVNEGQKTQQQNSASDDLNYAAVNFRQKERRREVEPNVVYSATR